MPFSPKPLPNICEQNEKSVSRRSIPSLSGRRNWLSSFTGILVPLRRRNYRLLVGGQLVSNIGNEFYLVALPWFLLSRGSGAQALGLVLAAYGIPRVGSLLLGGPLSDRLGPRKVMLLSDGARTMVMALFAFVVLLYPTIWLLCALAACNGAFTGMFTPAAWSITAALLPDNELQAGNALNTGARDGAGILGSSIAGVVVSVFQPAVAFVFDALSFVVSTVTLALMRSPQTVLVQHAQEEAAMRGGAEQMRPMTFWQLWQTSRFLRTMLIRVTFMNLGSGAAFEVALPIFAHDALRSGASGYGFILAAFAVGALLGALGAGTLGTMPFRYTIGLAFFIVQANMMMLIPFLSSVVAVSLAMFVAGVMNGLGNVTGATIMQQVLPRPLMGRIMGALALTNFGFYPLSVALGSVVVVLYGPLFLFLLNGALIIVPCVYSMVFLREFWHL